MSRGVTMLTGHTRTARLLECACAWVACDADGCDAMVLAPDRSDAGDAIVSAMEEGWVCGDDGDRCGEHAGGER